MGILSSTAHDVIYAAADFAPLHIKDNERAVSEIVLGEEKNKIAHWRRGLLEYMNFSYAFTFEYVILSYIAYTLGRYR